MAETLRRGCGRYNLQMSIFISTVYINVKIIICEFFPQQHFFVEHSEKHIALYSLQSGMLGIFILVFIAPFKTLRRFCG